MRTSLALLVTALVLVTGYGCDRNASTTGNPSVDNTNTTKPDNTAINKRDANTTGPVTPMNQGEGAGDIRITADIRKAVMDDNSLSTNAHNVKIITYNGVVVLRGVVDTDAEKSTVEGKAKNIAGVTSVNNELEVKKP